MLEFDQKKYLQQLLLALAEPYRFPDAQFFQELESGQWEATIKELWQKAGLVGTDTIWLQYPSFSTLKQEYVRCFMGGGARSAPPIESIYKVWTEDPSAEIVIARQKGYLMGDGALHIQYLLQIYNIELPAKLAQKPDHLVVLLELLVFFLENLKSQETIQFLQDHFDWLRDFYEKLEEIGAQEFYLAVTCLLINSIEQIVILLQGLASKREVS